MKWKKFLILIQLSKAINKHNFFFNMALSGEKNVKDKM